MNDDGCICVGNWRKIVEESEPFIDMLYQDDDGKLHNFFGIVHGKDDYYYGMSSQDGVVLLSCCNSIESHGFTRIV